MLLQVLDPCRLCTARATLRSMANDGHSRLACFCYPQKASCFERATWSHYGKHTFKEPGEGVVVHSTYCFSQPTRFAFLHLTSVWNPSSRGLGNPLLSSWALHTHGAETRAAKQPLAQNKTLKTIFNNSLPRFFNV